MVFHNLKDINVTPPPTEQPEVSGSFEYGCGILYRTTYYRDGVVLNSKDEFITVQNMVKIERKYLDANLTYRSAFERFSINGVIRKINRQNKSNPMLTRDNFYGLCNVKFSVNGYHSEAKTLDDIIGDINAIDKLVYSVLYIKVENL